MTASNLTQILLIQSGDVELNPGPKKSSSLTFFPWSLNGIAAHDFAKIPLIQSSGYNSLRSDHSSNTKKGGVYVL